MRTRLLTLGLLLALLLAVAGLALANGSVAWPRWVLSGGAMDAMGESNITMHGTLGQPVVGVITNSGGDVKLGQGFWHGGSLPESWSYIYLPLVLK